ncbi:MAG: thioredoxin family protein [Flavobacterium sp.]
MKRLFLGLLLAMTSVTFAQNWTNSLAEAKATAAKENKTIILVFSGSDWCGPCIKLDKTIWQSEEFITEAANKWVLLRADFPKKKEHALPAEQQKQNDALAEKYNREGNFPLVVVLDQNGKVLGKTGFKNLAPSDYITHLHSFETK